MKKLSFFLSIILSLALFNAGFAKEYSVVDFGAVPDGFTLNTTAIQEAIDKAHKNGGGKVIVPSGVFLSGTIKLKGNVELHLQKNAVILGSINVYDYSKSDGDFALIAAKGQNNISISGAGTIENIKIYDTFRSALAFEAVDGGTIENIIAKNITATNTGNAIFIRLGHRNFDGKVGTVRNIHIENIVVDIPFGAPDINYNIRGPELPFFHNPFPASITGIPGYYVENVSLENIEISYPGRANNGYAHVSLWNLDIVPENEGAYPEFSMFGELPSWGFYVRHVNGLELNNVRLNVRKEDFRPACVFDDVKNLKVEGGNITSPTKTPQLVLKDVHEAEIKNLTVDWEKLEEVPGYGKNVNINGVKLINK